MKRSDTDIRRDVEAELQWDPSIDDRQIGVMVSEGIVTLRGEVTHLMGRWAAEDIAKRVSGVRAIANEIQVKIPLSGIRSDTEIAEAAVNTLRWNMATASSSITPIVQEGCVTLIGKVMWGFQKQAAERSVRALSGVRHVTNEIVVASSVTVADVKHRMEEALQRITSPRSTRST
jgi:osmotically-inducible protein OsmY